MCSQKSGEARPQERSGGLPSRTAWSLTAQSGGFGGKRGHMLRYRSKRTDDAAVIERLRELATERPRFGYRRLEPV
jgi:hypothetical protein